MGLTLTLAWGYGMAFDRLRGLALTAEKSAEFLDSAADTIK